MGKKNSKLEPEVLTDLKNETEFNEREIKEWYNGFLIDYPHGYLTVNEFKDIFTQFYPNGKSDTFAEHTFRTFDHNNDGQIDFREFLTALSVTSRGTIDEKLKWVYSMYDADGNGYICKKEMLVIVKAIFQMVHVSEQLSEGDAEKRVERIYEKLDKNSDGQLSLEEFMDGAKTDPTLSYMLRGDMTT